MLLVLRQETHQELKLVLVDLNRLHLVGEDVWALLLSHSHTGRRSVLILHLLGHSEELIQIEENHLDDGHRCRVGWPLPWRSVILRPRAALLPGACDLIIVSPLSLDLLDGLNSACDRCIDLCVELLVSECLEQLQQDDEDPLRDRPLAHDRPVLRA